MQDLLLVERCGAMAKKRRLLILGPSFRRKKTEMILAASDRYDGLFFRTARKNLSGIKNVDVVVMTDDLTLVEGSTPLGYLEPEGTYWGRKAISEDMLEEAARKNKSFLERKLINGRYSEVFISMGKKCAAALPALGEYRVSVLFPASGGPGPKAQALKEWLNIDW
jgi:hypothetical protein